MGTHDVKPTWCASSCATTVATHCLLLSDDSSLLYNNDVERYVIKPQFSIAPASKSGIAIKSITQVYNGLFLVIVVVIPPLIKYTNPGVSLKSVVPPLYPTPQPTHPPDHAISFQILIAIVNPPFISWLSFIFHRPFWI